MSRPAPLASELNALRQVLDRLMTEEVNLESLCKHVPRVVSVCANVARIQAGLEADQPSELMEELSKALLEIQEEAENGDRDETGEEKFAW